MEDNKIALKIKNIREQRNLTPENLAELSDVTIDMVNKLEQGLLAPSLTPLLKIARALGVRLGTFLDDIEKEDPVIVRAGKTEKSLRFTGETDASKEAALDFFSLGEAKKDRHMEPFIVSVKPKEAEEKKLSSHEGEEFIYVLDGAIEV